MTEVIDGVDTWQGVYGQVYTDVRHFIEDETVTTLLIIEDDMDIEHAYEGAAVYGWGAIE